MNVPSSSDLFIVIFLLFDVQPRDNFIFVMDNLIFEELKIVVYNREKKNESQIFSIYHGQRQYQMDGKQKKML